MLGVGSDVGPSGRRHREDHDGAGRGPAPRRRRRARSTLVETRWALELSPTELVLPFSTFSRVGTRTPEARTSVLDALRDHLAHHPATAGRTTLAYPYRCLTVLYRRR
jgi:hypothetical protein